MKHTYMILWQDADGSDHSKQYDDEATAIKAKRWLIEQGAVNIDLSIRAIIETTKPISSSPELKQENHRAWRWQGNYEEKQVR